MGFIVIAIAAVGAVILEGVATRNGLAYSPDAAIYLGTARNLLHGRGLTSPITLVFTDYFTPRATAAFHGALPITTLSPLYPISLAGVGLFGVQVVTAARVVGIACLAISTFLVGNIVLRLTGQAWLVALGVIALFLGAGPMSQGFLPGSWLLLSASVLSEVLFLAIILATLAGLARLLVRGGRMELWWTGAGIGLAVLTRYLGAALLVTAAILVLTRRGWPLATRLRRLAFVGVLGVGPVLVWLTLLQALVGRGSSPVPVRFHPLRRADLSFGLKNVVHWFIPTSVPMVIAASLVAALLVMVVAMTVATRRPGTGLPDPDAGPAEPDEASRLLGVLALFVGAYVICLVGSRLFVNANLEFDIRFLAPIRPIAYILVVSIAFQYLWRFGLAVATAVVVVACILAVVPFAGSSADLVRTGMAGGVPRSSPTLTAVKRLPRDALLVSNAPDAVWGTGRVSVLVPIKRVRESGLMNRRYRADVREVGELLQRRDSYLVMFGGFFPGVLADADDLERAFPLRPVARFADGTIYQRAACRVTADAAHRSNPPAPRPAASLSGLIGRCRVGGARGKRHDSS